MTETPSLSVKEVAHRLGVTPRSVQTWIAAGSFPHAYRLNPDAPQSPWRIPSEDVAAIFDRRKPEVKP